MKKVLFVSVLGAMSVCAASAFDFNVTGPYVGLRAKYDNISMEHLMDTGESGKVSLISQSIWGGGVTFGAKLFDVVRAEFEYSFGMGERTNDIANMVDLIITEKLMTHSLFANVYYDFNIRQLGGFVPYIGVGAGMGIKNLTTDINLKHLNVKYTGVDNTFTSFLWNIGAGVSYAIDNHFTLDLGYRYMDYGKETFDSHPSSAPGETFKNELDMSSVHEIYIGARYNF